MNNKKINNLITKVFVFLQYVILFLSIYLILSSTYYKIFPKNWRGYISNSYQLEIDSYSDTLLKINIELKKDNTFESVQNINKIYNNGIAYIWPDQISSITFSENWILFLAQFLDPILTELNLQKASTNAFSNFESYKYERALGRGFGICSQNAIGLSNLLNRLGNINARVVGLGGHVVVEVELNDKNIILDPSFGISLPFSLTYAQNNLDKVKKYYQYTNEPEIFIRFDESGNIYIPKEGNYIYTNNYKKQKLMRNFEFYSDYLSILIPLIFIIIFKPGNVIIARAIRYL